MNPPRELVAMPDRCPGQISWHYDRTEIIADGVVHAIGVCLGLIGSVTIVVNGGSGGRLMLDFFVLAPSGCEPGGPAS